MTRKLLLISWLLLFSLSASYFAGPDAWGLSEHYKQSFKRQLTFIVSKHPKYFRGGSEDLERGLDCSGYLFLAAKWAGIPGVTRTTAYRMSMGLGGWIGRDIALDAADECDLIFWTLDDERPNGHVGTFLRDPAGYRKVTHASFSRGVILENLNQYLMKNLGKVRRLTIGE